MSEAQSAAIEWIFWEEYTHVKTAIDEGIPLSPDLGDRPAIIVGQQYIVCTETIKEQRNR